MSWRVSSSRASNGIAASMSAEASAQASSHERSSPSTSSTIRSRVMSYVSFRVFISAATLSGDRCRKLLPCTASRHHSQPYGQPREVLIVSEEYPLADDLHDQRLGGKFFPLMQVTRHVNQVARGQGERVEVLNRRAGLVDHGVAIAKKCDTTTVVALAHNGRSYKRCPPRVPTPGKAVVWIVVLDGTGVESMVEVAEEFSGDDTDVATQLHEAVGSRLASLSADLLVIRRADRPARARNSDGPAAEPSPRPAAPSPHRPDRPGRTQLQVWGGAGTPTRIARGAESPRSAARPLDARAAQPIAAPAAGVENTLGARDRRK